MVMWSRRYRQPLCHCTKYANLQSFFPEQCHFLMSWRHTSPPPPLSPSPPPPPPQQNINYDGGGGGGGEQMTDWHFSNYDTTDLKKWWWPCWLISCMTLDKYLQRRLVLSTTKQQQGRRKVWKSGGWAIINVVGINCLLVDIGLTDMTKTYPWSLGLRKPCGAIDYCCTASWA